MNKNTLLTLLKDVSLGRKTPEEALENLNFMPYRELCSGINLDLARDMRTGQPEVVFGQGKSLSQLKSAVGGLFSHGQPVLVTRLQDDSGAFLREQFPEGEYFPDAGLFILGKKIDISWPFRSEGRLMIIAAGAADLRVALEAYATARFYGIETGMTTDVGVAGLHRLLPKAESIKKAEVMIVVAGMEGALPSVIAGLFGKPVIAVPTSVCYGAGFGGIAPLLAMLNSCATGVAVVNIDNGFGAAAMAAKILSGKS